jgi:hypothetical protein
MRRMKAQKYLFGFLFVTIMYFMIAVLASPQAIALSA